MGKTSLVTSHSFPPRSFHDWWKSILKEEGKRYNCYAFLLLLPSDEEAVTFFTSYGAELHHVSGKHCLVIALSDTKIKSDDFNASQWNKVLKDQLETGYSVQIANYFKIELTSFPCMLFFERVNGDKYLTISLKGLTASQIGQRIRVIIDEIGKAAENKENVLDALSNLLQMQQAQLKTQEAATGIGGFIGKTFQTAVEAIIKAAFNP